MNMKKHDSWLGGLEWTRRLTGTDLGNFLKSNVSSSGFRDRGDLVSDELNNSFNSRTYSDGSNGPPHGM